MRFTSKEFLIHYIMINLCYEQPLGESLTPHQSEQKCKDLFLKERDNEIYKFNLLAQPKGWNSLTM